MDFTDKEREAWHAARRGDNDDSDDGSEAISSNVCLHCGNAFASSAGVVTEDAAICDVCND